MSKMSQLHAETAPDRADSAESDARYLADAMRVAVADLRLHAKAIKSGDFTPNDSVSFILSIATDLENAAGKGL